MTNLSDADSTLLRNLREIATRQKASITVTEHLEHYFADANVAYCTDSSPEDLYGAALQHYRLGFTRPPGQVALAFYVPDFDRHGWHSPHTMIDIVTDDMPFLVDSITQLIYRQGLSIHRLMHPLLGVKRDATGVLEKSSERTSGTRTESWIHLEIDRLSDAEQIETLRNEIQNVLADVRATVEDHVPMLQRISLAIKDLEQAPVPENESVIEFLRWIAADNFVFLGYTYYGVESDDAKLKRAADSGLGLLRRTDHPRFGRCLAGIPTSFDELDRLSSALTLVKADGRSTVHRPKYLDFIGVHYRDASGKILGEHVFIGLYAICSSRGPGGSSFGGIRHRV